MPLTKKIIFSTIILISIFIFLEIATRSYYFFINKDYCAIKFSIEQYSSIYDSEVGYIPKPGKKSGCRNENYFINKNNLRNQENENYKIFNNLIVGDSFGFGDEVSDEYSPGFLLEKLFNKKFINAAVYGYGLDQSLIRAKKIEQQNKKIKNIFLIIAGGALDRVTLFERNGISKPYYIYKKNELTLHYPKEKKFRQSSKDNILLRSYFVFHTLRKLGLIEFLTQSKKNTDQNVLLLSCMITKNFHEYFYKKNINFVVIYFRSGHEIFLKRKNNLDLSNNYLNCIKDYNIKFIDTFDILNDNKHKKLYFSKNFGHPTEYAQELISKHIYDNIRLK